MACPERDHLHAFLRQNGPPPVADHVESCPECQRVLAELDRQPDLIMRQLPEAARQQPFSEVECNEAIAPVAALGSDPSSLRGGTQQAGVGAMPSLTPPLPSGAIARVAALGSDPSSLRGGTQQAGVGAMPSPTPPLPSGFEFEAHLGKGGWGWVCKARQVSLDRSVAVKILYAPMHSPEALARFERESRAIGRLSHENIVKVFDAGKFDAGAGAMRHFLVMEFLQGRSLADILRRRGSLKVPDACEIIRQALAGLAYVHDHTRQVHRDIKPGNLMVSDTGTVKLLDFGLVTSHPALEPADSLTDSTQPLGTPCYMAPEQALNPTQVDVRADLYSLGCTLYHCLAGRPPFQGPSHVAVILSHQHDEVGDVRSLRDGVPDALADLLRCLLAKQPEDRPATPSEVARLLDPFCHGHNLRALLDDRGPDAPAQQLRAVLKVSVWNDSMRRFIPVESSIRTGARLRIEATVNRPAHLYLVWINSQGHAQPLYPWPPGEWEPCPPSIKELQIVSPSDLDVGEERREQTWEVNTPAGLETLVLLVREDDALGHEGNADLAQQLKFKPSQAPGQFPAKPVWFERWRGASMQAEGKRLNLVPTPVDDPIDRIHAVLEKKVLARFNLVKAVSFTNLGSKGGQP